MAIYRTLGPITYIDDGVVKTIDRAGVRVDLSPAQASGLEGLIAIDHSEPTDLPRATVLYYDSLPFFPDMGYEHFIYAAYDTGRFYRWNSDTKSYVAMVIGGGGMVNSVNGKLEADVILDADDIPDGTTNHKFATEAQLAKIDAIAGVGATGAAVVQSASPEVGRSVLGAAPIDDTVYASSEGIVASPSTDVSASFGSLLNSAPSGATIQLQGGTYNVSTLRSLAYNNDVTIRGVPGKTRLIGDGSITVNNYAADVMVRVDGGSIRFEHIAFENTGTVVGMKGLMELDDIEFNNCTFTGCTGIAVEIYDPTGVTTRLGQGKQVSWRNFRMTNCRAYDCEMGVVLRTDGGYDSVIVANTVFSNVGWAGVWVGTEYGLAVDRTLFQRLQSCVTIHDNVFRNMRLSAYAAGLYFVTVQVNAIVALGQVITIHDNLIENLDNSEVWDDCEAIYTKGRYFDIHDNILVDAGGFEAAIMVKGVAYDKSTTLTSSMNGLTLPRATIEVASTEGFLQPTSQTAIMVMTSNGPQVVQFTGRTPTSFTGCTGGTGTMSTGGLVRGEISPFAMTGVSQPGKIHHNTVVFTRTDRAQNGITSTMPGVEISDNLVDGATNRAITAAVWADNCVIKNNRVVNHHGDNCFLIGASNVTAEGNVIEEMDGSYFPAATSLRPFYVIATAASISGITLRNNVFYNRLEVDGTRSAASEKTRFAHIQGISPHSVSDIRLIGNRARNVNISVNATVDGPISDLIMLDNDWQNEDGTAITQSVNHASPRTIRDAGTLRGSSGTGNALALRPSIAQSGTAGYSGILLDVTETSTGSGTKRLIDAKVGGTTRFAVDNAGNVTVGGVLVTSGSVAPEGAVTAPVGSLYLRTGGGAGTTVYMKESGAGNTGWVALGSAFGRQLATAADANAVNALLSTGVNPQTGVSYTAALSDAQKLVTMNNAAANIFSIPTNLSVAFPIGTTITVAQLGAGQTSFAAVTPGTTTVRAAPGAKIAHQYGLASAIKIATDEWLVIGALAA